MTKSKLKQLVKKQHIERGIKKYKGVQDKKIEEQLKKVQWNYTAYRFEDQRILLVFNDQSYGVLYTSQAALEEEINLHPFIAPVAETKDTLLVLGKDIQKGIKGLNGSLNLAIQRHLDNANWKYTPYLLSDNRVLLVYPNKLFAVLYKSENYLYEVMETTREETIE